MEQKTEKYEISNVGWDVFFNEEEMNQIPSSKKNFKLPIKNWKFPSLYIPKVNKQYKFKFGDDFRKLLQYLVGSNRRGRQSPYIYGPHGCGKTSEPIQIAARLHFEVRQVYVSTTTEAADLYGSVLPTKSGGAEFVKGVLLQAMQAGQWCIINEFDLLDPAQQKELNQVFEEGKLELPNGTVVEAHKNFRLIVTANTNGTSGSFGDYKAKQADPSVLDRFFFIKKDYLSKEEERAILEKEAETCLSDLGVLQPTENPRLKSYQELIQSQTNDLVIPEILEYASTIRDAYKNALNGIFNGEQDGAYTLSHRTTIEWLKQTIEDFFWQTDQKLALHNSIRMGLQYAFINSLGVEAQEPYLASFDLQLGEKLKAATV